MQIDINLEKTISDAVAAAVAPERIGEIITKKVIETVDRAVDDAFGRWGDFSKAVEKAVKEITPHEMTLDKQADWNHFITHAINQRLTAYNEQRLTEAIMPTLDKLLEKPPESVKLSELVRDVVKHWREYEDNLSPALNVEESSSSAGYKTVTISKQKSRYSSLSKDLRLSVTPSGEVYSFWIDNQDVSKVKFAGPFYNVEQKLFQMYACRTKLEIDVTDIEDVDLDFDENEDD